MKKTCFKGNLILAYPAMPADDGDDGVCDVHVFKAARYEIRNLPLSIVHGPSSTMSNVEPSNDTDNVVGITLLVKD